MLGNLWAVRRNVMGIRRLSVDCRQLDVFAVIKEDGYGCGLPVGFAALDAGATGPPFPRACRP